MASEPKSPLRTVDPQPMDSQSPVMVNPYPTPPSQSYSGPSYKTQTYNPDGYTPQEYQPRKDRAQEDGYKPYNPQDYVPKPSKDGDARRPGSKSPGPALQDYRGEDSRKTDPKGTGYDGEYARTDGYRKEDARSDSYRKGDARSDDYRKSDARNDDYRKEDARKDDYRKDDYRKDDYRKDDYRKEDKRSDSYRKDDARKDDYRKDDRGNDTYRKEDDRTKDPKGQDYTPKPYNPQDYASSKPNPGQDFTPKPYNPQDFPPPQASKGPVGSGPGIGPVTGPVNGPYPAAEYPGLDPDNSNPVIARPGTQLAQIDSPNDLRDLRNLKTNCQFGLREFLSLQRQRRSGDTRIPAYELDSRIQYQAGMVLTDLRILQGEVRGIAKGAENHRWRKWIIGGAIATFIPLVRKFFKRTDDEDSAQSSNDTEYAFRKSQGLVGYIQHEIFGSGRLAKFAFIVFAVLYVFSNEVSLRVARTMQKRIKKLVARIERGDSDIDEKELKVLDGWRWRILLW